MKYLLFISLLSSLSLAKAAQIESSASQKFLSYLPQGQYTGLSDAGVDCTVSVSEVNFPKKDILVQVREGGVELSKLIAEHSDFAHKDYKREFIQTDRSFIGASTGNFVERIVRTVSAGTNAQYVVVSYAVTLNRHRDVQTAECVINL